MLLTLTALWLLTSYFFFKAELIENLNSFSWVKLKTMKVSMGLG